MQEDIREVTTFCSYCGAPWVWVVREEGAGTALAAAA